MLLRAGATSFEWEEGTGLSSRLRLLGITGVLLDANRKAAL